MKVQLFYIWVLLKAKLVGYSLGRQFAGSGGVGGGGGEPALPSFRSVQHKQYAGDGVSIHIQLQKLLSWM